MVTVLRFIAGTGGGRGQLVRIGEGYVTIDVESSRKTGTYTSV